MSDPPPYGFRAEYSPEIPPMGSSHNPHHYPSGVELSYPMPMPMPHAPTQPSTTYRRPSTASSSSSSSSSSTSSGESYRLGNDYANYPPIGYSWQKLTVFESFPFQNAIRAGRDQDGTNIYAGRAFHEGDMIPCKIIPEKQACYVSYGGEEIFKNEFEILRTGELGWEFAANGQIPPGAVQVGRTSDGEILYMGRCMFEGSQTPGKIQPSHGCLYIPFNGQEISVTEYEVLVVQ